MRDNYEADLMENLIFSVFLALEQSKSMFDKHLTNNFDWYNLFRIFTIFSPTEVSHGSMIRLIWSKIIISIDFHLLDQSKPMFKR